MHLIFSLAYSFGALICHQRPDRSFFWGDHQFPVCARCTGIYVSGVVGLMGWAGFKAMQHWRRIAVDPGAARAVMIAAAAPTAFSLVTGTLRIWDGTNIVRALLALPLGLCAGVIVAAVVTKDLR